MRTDLEIRLEFCLSGTLYIVATPIGNVADISERAINVLKESAVIAVEDTRHSGRLMQVLGITTPMLSYHEHNEAARAELLLQKLVSNQDVALISDAGTPLISDPGYALVKKVHEQGFRVVPVPGPCAVIAALCSAGLPTDRFVFEGFLPAKAVARRARLQELKSEIRTLVFYEAPHRIEECLSDMVLVLGAERNATLARELTKTFETIIPSTLNQLLERIKSDENQSKGEIVIVVEGGIQADDASNLEAEKILKILMEELPLKQAAALAARITGTKKNWLYDLALSWQNEK